MRVRIPRRSAGRWCTTTAAVIAMVTCVAQGASVGGADWAVAGPARVVLKKSGLRPIDFAGNARLRFDGAPADASGAATLDAYDATGRQLLAVIAGQWETGRRASFGMELDHEDLAGFLAGRIEESAGVPAACSVLSTRCKGALGRDGESVRLSVTVSGTTSLDGGPPLRMKTKLRLR